MRAKQDVYLKAGQSEKETEIVKVHSFDELINHLHKVDNELKATHNSNENFISNLENDLSVYSEMIVEEMQTKSHANEIKKLLLGRLDVLLNQIQEKDNSVRISKAIKRAELLLEKIKVVYDNLPEKINGRATNFGFNISDENLTKLFVNAKKRSIFINPDFDHFVFVLTGQEIPKGKTPYQRLALNKGGKESLFTLLIVDILEVAENPKAISKREIKRRAGYLFVFENGDEIGELSNPK